MAMVDVDVDTEPPVLGRAATDGIVVVEIGTEQREYHVHKALLTHHSEYFRRALSGSWKEAQEGVIPLHDIDPATFNIYVHWLYTQSMPSIKQIPSITELEDLKTHDAKEQAPLLRVYIRAYIFGDRILSPAFRGTVLERLHLEYFPGRMPYGEKAYAEAIAYAFANAASKYGILFDLVEDYALKWIAANEEMDEERGKAFFGIDVQEKLPSAFLARVMDYRLKNSDGEMQDLSEWFGVKDVLLSM